jgi:hypothetical protein
MNSLDINQFRMKKVLKISEDLDSLFRQNKFKKLIFDCKTFFKKGEQFHLNSSYFAV